MHKSQITWERGGGRKKGWEKACSGSIGVSTIEGRDGKRITNWEKKVNVRPRRGVYPEKAHDV